MVLRVKILFSIFSLLCSINCLHCQLLPAQYGVFHTSPSRVAGYTNGLNFSTSLYNYASLPPATYFSGDFTIECWVYPTAHTNWSRVIDFGNGAGNNCVLLATSYGTSGQPGFYVGGSQFAATNQIPLSQWTHLAATLSGSTATIYINGVASGTASFPTPANVTRSNNYIGRSNWGWGDPAPSATFDDLRIWSVARTASQIVASMNNELTGLESNLVAYFKFNEGTPCGNNTSVSTLVNSAATGSMYNATLSGFTLNNTCVSNFVTGKGLITSAAVLHLDAGNTSSYPESGTTWTDISGNANNGTLTNGPTYSSANGGHIVFDGSNDYVSLSSGISSTDNLTYEAWVNPSLLNDFRVLLNHDNWASGYVHFQFSNNRLQFALNGESDKYSTYTFSTNTWYHVVAVYSKSLKTVSFYVNGNLTNTETYSNPPTISNTSIKLGAWNGTGRFFNGKIGLIRIYAKTLNSSEVLNNYNVSRARFGL